MASCWRSAWAAAASSRFSRVDLQGPPQERLGPGVVPLPMEQRRQVAQAFGGGGVLLAQHLLADGQGLLESEAWRRLVPLLPEQQRQVVQAWVA